MNEMEHLTETPEEKAFFESRGSDPKPEPKPEPIAEAPKPEAPKPEAKPEPKPEVRAEEPKHVPLPALLEERDRRKAAEAKLEKLLQRFEKLAPVEEPKPLNVDEQPIEAIKDLVDFKQQTIQQQRQQEELRQIQEFGFRHAQEFAKSAPDFNDAYQHLRHARANQLVDSGQVTTAAELNAVLMQEEAAIIRQCAQWGVNPAQFIYNMSMGAGYSRPEAPKAAPEPAPAPSVEEKVKMAAEGHERAASSAKTPAGQGGPIDWRAIANLDDEEFDKATSGKNWRKIAGG